VRQIFTYHASPRVFSITISERALLFGEQVENLLIVKEGVKANDRVITEGMQKVRPGMAVRILLVGTDRWAVRGAPSGRALP
jgi:hypothetical protein